MIKEASLPELRRAIEDQFHPHRLLVRRGREGAVDLRVLADAFADAEDPLGLLTGKLEQHGLRLPERTLTLLKSPDDLEEGDEQLLFSQRLIGTPNWADALMLEPQPLVPDDRGFPGGVKVIAFWGLKGGVGRSTALAHVAMLLGRRQVKALAVDLDLESPALVGALTGDPDGGARTRFEDLVRQAGNPAVADAALDRLLEGSLLAGVDAGALVEVLGPSKADIPFVHALLGPLAPSVLYRGIRPPLRRLLEAAIRVSQARVVLLDARSGYCDESALAVLDLADEVVLFASPAPSTYPSLVPAVAALERSRRARGRPTLVHFVAGMLPAGDDARRRCLEELQAQLEQARAEIAEALATPANDLPADVNLISIDYSARIVENDGGLLVSGIGEGYRDLADRIEPPPLPTALAQIKEGWAAQVIREAVVPVPQAESADPQDLARLFTRTSDLDRFVRHDTCLVLGAKGTGKSYLRRICLEQPELIRQRSGVSSLQNVTFVEGYASPRAGRRARPPASQNLLLELDKAFGDRWRDAWSILALGRVMVALPEWQFKFSNPVMDKQFKLLVDAQGEQAVLDATTALITQGQPLLISDTWRSLDEWCERKGKRVTLLFDDLDVALGETEEGLKRRRGLLVGLLDQTNASWISTRNVGVKVFLRKDIFDGLGTEEQAKYQKRDVTLNWRPDDIWRLIVRAMAAASETFRTHLAQRGVNIENLEETPREDWAAALELIWGDRLGTGESNTRSTSWAEKRLRDGKERLFPRAALWLIEAAVRIRKGSRVESAPLLDPRSLRAAMPEVSSARLEELLTESGQEQRSRILRLTGFKSYQNEDDFLKALKNAGESEPVSALNTLKELGIVETGSRRNKTAATSRIVDLYAFAPRLEIARLGRR